MTIRIGFAGAGSIARPHAKALADGGYTIDAIYDPNPVNAEAIGGKLCGSLEELVDVTDAVFVLTPTHTHRHIVETVAAAGKAVFCEKPLGVNLEDARAVRDAVGSVPNQVGLVLRSYGSYRRMPTLTEDPIAIVSRVDMPGRKAMFAGWRGDVRSAGGGILIELAFHDLDLMLWAMGPVESVACTTHGGAVEDVASLSMRFTSGATGSLVAVWHDVDECPFHRSLEIFCDRRWICADMAAIRWTDGDGKHVYEGREDANSFADFVRAVESGERPSPNVDDAYAVHEVIEAAYRSAGTGGEIARVG